MSNFDERDIIDKECDETCSECGEAAYSDECEHCYGCGATTCPSCWHDCENDDE